MIAIDDIPDNQMTPFELMPGGVVRATINPSGDTDWFRVAPPAGEIYSIFVRPDVSSGTPLNIFSNIRDLEGLPLTPPNGSNFYDSNAYGSFGIIGKAEQSDYFLTVWRDPFIGSYLVETERETPVSLVLGESSTGSFNYTDDSNFFTFDSFPGQIYRIDLGSVTGANIDAIELDHFAAPYSNVFIAKNDDGSWSYRNNEGGISYIRAFSNGVLGNYDLTIEELPPEEPSGVGTTLTLRPNVYASGRFDYPGDSDWWRIENLQPGAYLLNGPSRVRLLDEGGEHFSGDIKYSNTGYDTDNAYFYIEDTQTLYVNATGSRGAYSLRLVPIKDVVAGDATTSSIIAPGLIKRGRIDHPFDKDWHRLIPEEGKTYLIKPASIESGPYWNPSRQYFETQVYDSAGELISNYVYNNGFAYHALSDDPVYITAGHRYRDPPTDYELLVEEIADDFLQSNRTKSVLTLEEPVEATIDFVGDSDWHRLNVVAGQSYDFSVTTDGGVDLSIAVWRKGTTHQGPSEFVSPTGYKNGANSFYAPQDGSVFIAVRDNYWQNFVGSYSLTAALSDVSMVDDYPAGKSTAGVVTRDAPASGRLEALGDLDMFRFPIEAGLTYYVRAEANESVHITVLDGDLNDASSNFLFSGSGQFAGEFRAPVSDDYFITIGSASTAPLDYEIAVGPFDDIHWDMPELPRLQPNTGVLLAHDRGSDTDPHQITLKPGNLYYMSSSGDDILGTVYGDVGGYYWNYEDDFTQIVTMVSSETDAFLFGRASEWAGGSEFGMAFFEAPVSLFVHVGGTGAEGHKPSARIYADGQYLGRTTIVDPIETGRFDASNDFHFQTFKFDLDSGYIPDRVEIIFDHDSYRPSEGIDVNFYVDAIEFSVDENDAPIPTLAGAGIRFEAEADGFYSSNKPGPGRDKPTEEMRWNGTMTFDDLHSQIESANAFIF